MKKILNYIADKLKKIAIEGDFQKAKNFSMHNVFIRVKKGSRLIIGNNVIIRNYKINIEEGEFIIGDNTILQKSNNDRMSEICIEKGVLHFGCSNTISADFSVRYGGKCAIGNFNCINQDTEIRCDEKIDIGNFNMISYECMIYDTNTHVLYSKEKRRELTIKDFPNIGREYEKPITKPVSIQNDCWFGKRSVILKGCEIGSNSVIAACAVVTKNMPENHIAYGNPAQIKLRNL